MPVDGVLRLVSGAVLFPQRWHLLEKLGMDMTGIHLPVPLYEDVIGPAVNHFMNRLKVGKPVWRANWAIVDDPTLFQPLNEVGISLKLVIPSHRSKKRWLQWCLWCELWCCFIFKLFWVYMLSQIGITRIWRPLKVIASFQKWMSWMATRQACAYPSPTRQAPRISAWLVEIIRFTWIPPHWFGGP